MGTQATAARAGLVAILVAAALTLASCGAAGSAGGEGHEGVDHGSGHGSGETGTAGEQGNDRGSADHGSGHGSETMSAGEVSPEETGVEVEMRAIPASPEPGETTELAYRVSDAGSGDAITELPVDHERQMHLISVSRDLEHFQHIHPKPTGEAFAVTTEFPSEGTYVLFDEFVRGERKVLDRREIEVGGGGGEASLSPDLAPKTVDGLTVSLEAPEEVRTGEEASFTYTLEKDGAPADDLEPYLGAPAHIAVVSEDTRQFAHTHGEAEASEGGSGGHGHGEGGGEHADHAGGGETFGLEIGFHHTFERPGAYKIWAEFNHHGSVVAVPFVVEVV